MEIYKFTPIKQGIKTVQIKHSGNPKEEDCGCNKKSKKKSHAKNK